ncbi:hypothetical protein AZA_47849 [Nitrospirillum viridazoti Y2]|nr:hypothetical protein AZA_47849 [Nitrospirillum amazonense Y2]
MFRSRNVSRAEVGDGGAGGTRHRQAAPGLGHFGVSPGAGSAVFPGAGLGSDVAGSALGGGFSSAGLAFSPVFSGAPSKRGDLASRRPLSSAWVSTSDSRAPAGWSGFRSSVSLFRA